MVINTVCVFFFLLHLNMIVMQSVFMHKADMGEIEILALAIPIVYNSVLLWFSLFEMKMGEITRAEPL